MRGTPCRSGYTKRQRLMLNCSGGNDRQGRRKRGWLLQTTKNELDGGRQRKNGRLYTTGRDGQSIATKTVKFIHLVAGELVIKQKSAPLHLGNR